MITQPHVFEILLPGFDDSNAETDHLVKWVQSPSEERVREKFPEATHVTMIPDELLMLIDETDLDEVLS